MNQSELISSSVKQFLNKNKVKIIIGTPCFGGMIHNGFFQSMLDLSVNFTKLNIPFEMMTIGNESLIQRARNGIVARFMGDDTATHLMFIDADITFSWISIVKLLLSGKELSGGCYPKKCFNWDKIKHHIQKNGSLKDDELMAKSLDYVFNPIYHKEGENVVIRLDNGMAQVKDIGTGFMLIRKSVINKMIAKFPDTKYRNNVAGYSANSKADDYFYCLFDCAIDPVSRVYLSEDYLFCKRWIDIGGELWLDLNTNLNHTGIIDYKGCLSITVGEVDVLNKDAQILKQQADNEKEKEKNEKEKNEKEKSKKIISDKEKEIKRQTIEKQVNEAKLKQKELEEKQEKEKQEKEKLEKELLQKTNEIVSKVVNEESNEETKTETKEENNDENKTSLYNNHHC